MKKIDASMPAAAPALPRMNGGYAQSSVPLDAMMQSFLLAGSFLNARSISSRTIVRTSASVRGRASSWVAIAGSVMCPSFRLARYRLAPS